MRKGQGVPEKCWKPAAAPEVQAPCGVSSARLNPIPGSTDTWLWCSGDRGFPSDLCSGLRWCQNTPTWPEPFYKGYCTLPRWTWIKSKEKPATQLPIPQSRTVTEFSFTSPFRSSGSPDHNILKVNGQHKIFLEARKHGARNSVKESPQKNYLLLFSQNCRMIWVKRNHKKHLVLTPSQLVHLRYPASPDHYGFEVI